jgi:hypothetical protein
MSFHQHLYHPVLIPDDEDILAAEDLLCEASCKEFEHRPIRKQTRDRHYPEDQRCDPGETIVAIKKHRHEKKENTDRHGPDNSQKLVDNRHEINLVKIILVKDECPQGKDKEQGISVIVPGRYVACRKDARKRRLKAQIERECKRKKHQHYIKTEIYGVQPENIT